MPCLRLPGVVDALTPSPQVAALIFAGILIAPILVGVCVTVKRYICCYVPSFRGAGGALMPNLQEPGDLGRVGARYLGDLHAVIELLGGIVQESVLCGVRVL